VKFLLAPSSQIAIGRLNRMSGDGAIVLNFFGFSVSDKPRSFLSFNLIKNLIN